MGLIARIQTQTGPWSTPGAAKRPEADPTCAPTYGGPDAHVSCQTLDDGTRIKTEKLRFGLTFTDTTRPDGTTSHTVKRPTLMGNSVERTDNSDGTFTRTVTGDDLLWGQSGRTMSGRLQPDPVLPTASSGPRVLLGSVDTGYTGTVVTRAGHPRLTLANPLLPTLAGTIVHTKAGKDVVRLMTDDGKPSACTATRAGEDWQLTCKDR